MLSGYDQWKLSYPPQWDKESDLLECQECGTPIDPIPCPTELESLGWNIVEMPQRDWSSLTTTAV